LQKLFAGLPSRELPPIAVVIHLNKDSQPNHAAFYAAWTHRRVLEAEDKMPLENDSIYFSPPGYHMLVEAAGTVSLSVEEPVHFSRPAIDLLFESAAKAFAAEVLGVLLTGANEDGALGMKRIQERGGRTVVQDPETADSRTMPLAALKLMAPDFIVGIENMGEQFDRFLQTGPA
jgi:two-component system chemotaxis response regulator CheB